MSLLWCGSGHGSWGDRKVGTRSIVATRGRLVSLRISTVVKSDPLFALSSYSLLSLASSKLLLAPKSHANLPSVRRAAGDPGGTGPGRIRFEERLGHKSASWERQGNGTVAETSTGEFAQPFGAEESVHGGAWEEPQHTFR
eukprot:3977949-Pyramimonas_sp.AAC.1